MRLLSRPDHDEPGILHAAPDRAADEDLLAAGQRARAGPRAVLADHRAGYQIPGPGRAVRGADRHAGARGRLDDAAFVGQRPDTVPGAEGELTVHAAKEPEPDPAPDRATAVPPDDSLRPRAPDGPQPPDDTDAVGGRRKRRCAGRGSCRGGRAGVSASQ